MKTGLYLAMLGVLCGFIAEPASAQNDSPSEAVAPDNTGINMRDRSPSEPTADQGGNQKSDREIMKSIRKSVVADKSLSTYGHNIKIISANGKVTLKGPVRSNEESQDIQDKATQIVGADNVTNELAVKKAQ